MSNPRLNRRHFLAGTTAALAAPMILRAHDALASSGTVRVYAWQDYIQPNIAEKFTAETGIVLELTTFGSNAEIESTVKSAGGTGFDVAFPTITNIPNYVDDSGEHLLMTIPDTVEVDRVIPSFLRDSAALGGVFNGEQKTIPFSWGTEGITRDTSAMDVSDADLSYADLFAPGTEGKAACRLISMIVGIGLHLDHTGELPSNRMLDAYRSEEDSRRIFTAVTEWVLERRSSLGAFWTNATEATGAFRDAGCIVGQTWDTTGLLLNRETPNLVYRAPREGAMTWLDSFGMLRGAQNIEQGVAFMNFMLQSEVGGMYSNNTGYNSAVTGAADFASEEFKRQFNEVYTTEVLNNMWWWQAATPFWGPIRNEFAEIIANA